MFQKRAFAIFPKPRSNRGGRTRNAGHPTWTVTDCVGWEITLRFWFRYVASSQGTLEQNRTEPVRALI